MAIHDLAIRFHFSGLLGMDCFVVPPRNDGKLRFYKNGNFNSKSNNFSITEKGQKTVIFPSLSPSERFFVPIFSRKLFSDTS